MVNRYAVALLLTASSVAEVAAFTAPPVNVHKHCLSHNFQSPGLDRPSLIACAASPSDGDNSNNISIEIPSFVVSPVLAQVYPALLAHKEKYGNVNIPLGSTDGKRCKTLRRLHFQNKLTEEETEHLAELGFRFHSFEDVYYENDFDEMLSKLIDYHSEFKTYQIPKKYEPDPELGAWVTMLRRLHKTDHLPQIQIDKLNALEFEWISTRKCGSSFMKKYREVLSYLSKVVEAGGDVNELLHEDNDMMKWIDTQRQVFEKGNLSESRIKYMDDLPGIDWRIPITWA